jgi:hypothetical protein
LLYLLSDRLKIFVPLSYTRSGPYPHLLVGFDLDLDLYVAPYCLFPTKPLSLINMLSRSTLLFALYAAAGAAAQTCYGLTGAILDHSFAPCNPDAKHSGCCATNRTTGADVCLDSGLCMSTTSDYMGTIWQPGCTDSTGKATECPQVCPGSM